MKPYLKSVAAGSLAGLIVAAIGVTFASRDGAGNYSLPAGNPVSTGNTISSTWANSTLSDIGAALTQSLSKDGQTTPTANLPMGGFRHTNVADATSRNQYATAGQLQDFSLQVLGSVSGTNTITGSLNPAITSYATGMLVSFTPANANTGATTIAINGLSARSIVKPNGDALVANDLVTTVPAVLVASSSAFVLLNPATDMSAAQVLAKLLTVDGSSSGLDADTVDGAAAWTTANDGTGSGLDADLLDGVTSSETATSSTIARRNSSGYLLAAYFNQSSSQSEVATPTQVFVETSSDGFLRKSSIAQLQDDLTTRNISGKAGIGKTLSTSGPSGGSDGDIWYRY